MWGDAVTSALAEALYRALVNCPCRCTLRWVKDGAEREVVAQCQRCAAVARYEAENPAPVPPVTKIITSPRE